MDRIYEEGEYIFLWFKLQNISLRFGKNSKLSPQIVGPFEILDNIGHAAYHVTMPLILDCMHDVFHVLVLCKHVQGPSHIINWNNLQVT